MEVIQSHWGNAPKSTKIQKVELIEEKKKSNMHFYMTFFKGKTIHQLKT